MGARQALNTQKARHQAINAMILTARRATFAVIAQPLATRLIPGALGAVLLKIGSLDNPADFIGPDAAIYTDEKHDFHVIGWHCTIRKLPG